MKFDPTITIGAIVAIAGLLFTVFGFLANQWLIVKQTSKDFNGLREDFTGLRGDFKGLQASIDSLKAEMVGMIAYDVRLKAVEKQLDKHV